MGVKGADVITQFGWSRTSAGGCDWRA